MMMMIVDRPPRVVLNVSLFVEEGVSVSVFFDVAPPPLCSLPRASAALNAQRVAHGVGAVERIQKTTAPTAAQSHKHRRPPSSPPIGFGFDSSSVILVGTRRESERENSARSQRHRQRAWIAIMAPKASSKNKQPEEVLTRIAIVSSDR